jgi:hypothetical protein
MFGVMDKGVEGTGIENKRFGSNAVVIGFSVDGFEVLLVIVVVVVAGLAVEADVGVVGFVVVAGLVGGFSVVVVVVVVVGFTVGFEVLLDAGFEVFWVVVVVVVVMVVGFEVLLVVVLSVVVVVIGFGVKGAIVSLPCFASVTGTFSFKAFSFLLLIRRSQAFSVVVLRLIGCSVVVVGSFQNSSFSFLPTGIASMFEQVPAAFTRGVNSPMQLAPCWM